MCFFCHDGSSWDHPRMCGENFLMPNNKASLGGSPPHVRGKRLLFSCFLPLSRITPACAGKTAKTWWPRCYVRDHPRMCGENADNQVAVARAWGSPPHVRGKLALSGSNPGGCGITPACAGKTGTLVGQSGRNWDHPRMCGENSVRIHKRPDQPGSPPHVRGKLIRPS